jgi:hypothetical protein
MGSEGAHGMQGDAVGVGDIADLKANEKKKSAKSLSWPIYPYIY